MRDDSEQRPVRVCLTRCPLSAPEQGVHSLPCQIHHNGPAAIKSYFRPEKMAQDGHKVVEQDDMTWRAEFRGVQLQGKRVLLRDLEMQGLVVEDAGMTHPEDEGRMWEVDSHFDEMTFWEVPNSGDEDTNLPATLAQWNELALAVRIFM